MQLISENTPGTGSGCDVLVPASDGQLTLGLIQAMFNHGSPDYRLPVGPRDTARVIITVTPRQATTFSAPGLTREGTHEWTYEYRFTGLQIRDP